MRRAKKEKSEGNRRALNALVYCIAVLAAFLIAVAAWMRYSRRRRPGESSEPGDAIERRIEAFKSNLGLSDGWIRTGIPLQGGLPRSRFVCPQCQSSCWTYPGRGRPACPFCGRVMARQGLKVSLAGGTPALPIMIRADAAPPHGDRGVCSICHTVVGPGSLPPALYPVGLARSAPKALWRGVAAPAIAPDAVRPTLIKIFGIEICPAPGAGVEVTGVMGNSYASNAGLRAGDIIIECNGAKVRGVGQFQQLVSRAAPESDASIKVLRNGRTRDLLVMVGEGEMEGFTPIRRP